MAIAGLWFAAAYLVGSVPVGLLVSRAWGIDIRRYGTGNIGASNVLRNLGFGPAAIVGVASFAQGLAPAWAADALTGSALAEAAAAVGAVAGYGWSFLLGFRGGRAVATATGALAAISPPGLLIMVAAYALGGLVRRPAPGVLLGLVAYLASLALVPRPPVLVTAAVLVVAIVIVKRFDGAVDDLRSGTAPPAVVLVGRLLFDRRPGQRLTGPNER